MKSWNLLPVWPLPEAIEHNTHFNVQRLPRENKKKERIQREKEKRKTKANIERSKMRPANLETIYEMCNLAIQYCFGERDSEKREIREKSQVFAMFGFLSQNG